MNLLSLNTAPSGAFWPTAQNPFTSITKQTDPIFNPGVLEHRIGSYTLEDDPSRITQWLERSTGEAKWSIDAAHIDSYADTAVKLASAVAGTAAHCRLAPLRGAARPCLLVEVMTRGQVEFEFFNFRQGASGKRDTEIRSELVTILGRKNPQQDIYRIQVVDTAIGGYGINALVGLLRSVHDEQYRFAKQSWVVELHLLHPTNGREDLERIESVKSRNGDRFQVVLNRYPVPDLIVEDFDEALGFTLEQQGMLYVAKPSVVGGRFLLKANGVIHLVESEDLSRTFDEFMCEAITNSLLTDPNRELVSVVWQDYQQKG